MLVNKLSWVFCFTRKDVLSRKARVFPRIVLLMEINGAPHSVLTGRNEIPQQKPDQWTGRCVHLVRTPCDFCCIVVSFSGAK